VKANANQVYVAASRESVDERALQSRLRELYRSLSTVPATQYSGVRSAADSLARDLTAGGVTTITPTDDLRFNARRLTVQGMYFIQMAMESSPRFK
jgi:hypothetical protein